MGSSLGVPVASADGSMVSVYKKGTQSSSSDLRTSSHDGHFVPKAHGAMILAEGEELEALAGCDSASSSDCPVLRIRQIGPLTDKLTPAPRRFPLLTCSPSRVLCIWCLKTRAEGGAAADCRALRIREIGT